MRTSIYRRTTQETDIQVEFNLNDHGQAEILMIIRFLDHMREQIAIHGLFDLKIKADGELNIDPHHNVEDVGLALVEAINQALGDRKGTTRMGFASVPNDEALGEVTLDFSGRQYCVFIGEWTGKTIPCLDIKDSRVVKGINFVNLRGADELVFLDISATVDGRKTTYKVLRAVADQVFLPLTVGGGISSLEDMRHLLLAGADKISINTAAVQNPNLLTEGAKRFGSQCIVLAIDARRSGDKEWEVVTHGGRQPTGRDAAAWARQAVEKGAGEILLTSMDADGTLMGYDLELTSTVAQLVNIPIIASGGAGKPEHFAEVFIDGQADAALAASLFHDNQLSIPELKNFLDSQNIPVRLVN